VPTGTPAAVSNFGPEIGKLAHVGGSCRETNGQVRSPFCGRRRRASEYVPFPARCLWSTACEGFPASESPRSPSRKTKAREAVGNEVSNPVERHLGGSSRNDSRAQRAQTQNHHRLLDDDDPTYGPLPAANPSGFRPTRRRPFSDRFAASELSIRRDTGHGAHGDGTSGAVASDRVPWRPPR
jgi:hypothetical protein